MHKTRPDSSAYSREPSPKATCLDKLLVLTYCTNMPTVPASKAKTNLRKLMGQTARSHEPIVITAEGMNAVLLAEEDWRAIQETVYLLSIPGMRQSIRKGLATPIAKCAKDLRW